MNRSMDETDILKVIIPSCLEDLPIVNGTQIIEEGPRVCPLCGCEVKFFFLNFQEQLLMCENVECQYPFGYEDLQFKRFEDVDASDMVSIRTRASRVTLMSPTGSMVSTHAWSEIDKMNRMYDEDSQSERSLCNEKKQKEATQNKLDKASINEIKKNVESIKGLNEELKQLSESSHVIKNEKWIKKLLDLQSMTKEHLLKPQEMEQIEEEIKQPEVKIAIQQGDAQTISTIQINLA
ncbi:uncharacterized protein LOC121733811 [Aricia agestis]|uniref:uncharacterized protein LOC121733811 n=1 Tax=Aricia agestis TaxID=91739 RepID=UPI001C202B33|nr:uncharacterized protein LOC121733811 [Aricia agestis]